MLHLIAKSLRLGGVWQRHLLTKALHRLCATLCVLYGLYILIDLSVNYGKHLYHLSPGDLTVHYLFDCLRRLPQILPFSLLLTTATLMLQMNETREMLAITLATSPSKAIYTPLLWLSLFSGLIMISLYEGVFFQTIALDNYKKTEIIPHKKLPSSLRSVALNNNLTSWLVYTHFDPSNNTFSSALLLEGQHQWQIIKNLKVDESAPHAIAQESLLFKRRKETEEVYWKQNPPNTPIELDLNHKELIEESKPVSSMNIFEIIKRLQNPYPLVERDLLHSLLYYRILQPLHCINAILIALFWTGPTSPLRLAGRRKSSFAIAIISSVVTLALYSILIQSGLLLSSTRLFPPYVSLLLPAILIPTCSFIALRRSHSGKLV